MKKLVSAISLVLMMCVLFSACGEKKKADVDLSEVYDEIKSEVALPEMVELNSADKLDRNYGITEDMVDAYAGGVDKSGVTMDEIVLIKAKDEDSAKEIEEKLEARLKSKLDQNRNYNPEQAAIIEKCEVERNDLYVTLIISKDAEKITDIFKDHLK